jgi:hypothetical protein
MNATRMAVFYFSTDPSASHDADPIWANENDRNPIGFVRAEIVEATDLSDALDKAKPLPGESVMNTHFVL